jgi:hypothetical protein
MIIRHTWRTAAQLAAQESSQVKGWAGLSGEHACILVHLLLHLGAFALPLPLTLSPRLPFPILHQPQPSPHLYRNHPCLISLSIFLSSCSSTCFTAGSSLRRKRRRNSPTPNRILIWKRMALHVESLVLIWCRFSSTPKSHLCPAAPSYSEICRLRGSLARMPQRKGPPRPGRQSSCRGASLGGRGAGVPAIL